MDRELDQYGVPFKYNPNILKIGTRVRLETIANSWGGGLNGLRVGEISKIIDIEERESDHHKYKYWVCLSGKDRVDSDWAYAGCFSILPPDIMVISDDGGFNIVEQK